VGYLILDTSSMLFGFSNNVNVFELAEAEFPRYKMLVSRGIVNELEAISRNKGKKGSCARVALMELRAKKIEIDNINRADGWILEKARRNRGSVVVTNDTPLAKRLLRFGTAVFKISRSGMLRSAR
jgi:rRNA-processing protein FCF1